MTKVLPSCIMILDGHCMHVHGAALTQLWLVLEHVPSRSVAFVCLFLLLSVVNSDKYLPLVKSRKGIFVGASG